MNTKAAQDNNNNDLFVKHINVYIKVESLASAHHVQSLTLAVNLCVVSGPNTIVCKIKKKGEERICTIEEA